MVLKREGKRLSDIGIATPLIDWRKLLRQAIRYDEEYTRKNARMRNGYFRHRIEQIPMPEAEILLDTSGSVSEVLLKNFLRECKNILDNSKVKVGCFNTEFHGFTELKNPEDIDNMRFPIGGGTDFNAAVGAFSRKAPNKIIFTDGKADMPKETVRNVIWVVFGDKKINPKGGKVINITGDDIGYSPVFNYCIDDTYISRDGYADESTVGLVILSDILKLKLCNTFPPKVYIEVADISEVVDLKDYVNPETLDSHFEFNKVLVIL